jgi:hypothetical protein
MTALDFKEYIWSAETFAALVPAVTAPAPACDATDVLKRLLTPRVSELTRLDKEISGPDRLAGTPDPDLETIVGQPARSHRAARGYGE